MSQVKAEVALNLLSCFSRLVQSPETTLVSFYITQKQHVKDSGWFSISGTDVLCKQTSDEETFVWFPGTVHLFFRICHLGIALLGRPRSRQRLNCLPMWPWIPRLQDNQSLTHTSATEFITSCWHSHVLKLPWIICTDVLPACTYNVWSLSIERMKSD